MSTEHFLSTAQKHNISLGIVVVAWYLKVWVWNTANWGPKAGVLYLPLVVVTPPTIKLFPLLLHNRNFATVMILNAIFDMQDSWYATPLELLFNPQGVMTHRLRTTDLWSLYNSWWRLGWEHCKYRTSSGMRAEEGWRTTKTTKPKEDTHTEGETLHRTAVLSVQTQGLQSW